MIDQSKREINRGRITVDVWVSCGICGEEESVDNANDAATNKAKAMGWHYTRADGWVCPECWQKRGQHADHHA